MQDLVFRKVVIIIDLMGLKPSFETVKFPNRLKLKPACKIRWLSKGRTGNAEMEVLHAFLNGIPFGVVQQWLFIT